MIWDQNLKKKDGGNGITPKNSEMTDFTGHICEFCGNNLKKMVQRRCCGKNKDVSERLRRDVHNPISPIFHPRKVFPEIINFRKIQLYFITVVFYGWCELFRDN